MKLNVENLCILMILSEYFAPSFFTQNSCIKRSSYGDVINIQRTVQGSKKTCKALFPNF